ncbi:MAG: hypothetical protein IKY02_03595, partial [Lachnospiraceae bacterium]|nr:hypothetical protein [Lachnospiraceae bacterium]
MNGTQFAEFMKKMLDWAKEDAEAAKIMDLIDVILAAKDTSLSDLREQLENPTEDLNKLTLQLTGYIDTKTGYLVRTEAEVKTDDTPEENQIFLDSLSYKSDIRLEEKTVRMNGEIKMHYAGSDLDVNAIRQLKSSMIWDKTKEEMTISAGGDDAESELVLEIKEASDSLTITPKKINVSDDEESALSKFDPSFITVRISAKADEPAVPTYKDILKMSTDELTDLLNGLLKKLQSLGLGNVLY